MGRHGGCCAFGITFAVNESVPFEVLALQVDLACTATETFWVKLLTIGRAWAGALVGLEVLTFNTVVTSGANGAIFFVVMLGAVRAVIEDVKVVRLERRSALVAYETGTVISAS